MISKKTLIASSLIILLSIIWLFQKSANDIKSTSEEIKIALREVGHKLLLANKDSTSLVLPVKQINDELYKQSFENEISIHPDSLVSIISRNFAKSNLPGRYIVEVSQCKDHEIAYSYKMINEKDKSIIPCGSRTLPKGCYEIDTQFLKDSDSVLHLNFLLLIIGGLVLYLILNFFKQNQSSTPNLNENNELQITLGDFIFYPNQSKLSLKRKETLLTKKEGELLFVLASSLNKVVKRQDLERQVWEDNGVMVGRSLDTYISKLRKHLKEDKSIKLTNIHGVGYKLEVT